MTAAPRLVALPLAEWEREGLTAALKGAGLPADDVGAADPLFWRFESVDTVPAGFGGLEIHGEDALLRSVVILPPVRRRGFGAAIVAALETEATNRGCRAIWLFTESATGFFERLGYGRSERTKAPEAIRATPQFADLCPASASVMVKRL